MCQSSQPSLNRGYLCKFVLLRKQLRIIFAVTTNIYMLSIFYTFSPIACISRISAPSKFKKYQLICESTGINGINFLTCSICYTAIVCQLRYLKLGHRATISRKITPQDLCLLVSEKQLDVNRRPAYGISSDCSTALYVRYFRRVRATMQVLLQRQCAPVPCDKSAGHPLSRRTSRDRFHKEITSSLISRDEYGCASYVNVAYRQGDVWVSSEHIFTV